jgi:cytoskeletal protein CcmA (bactofilin family)
VTIHSYVGSNTTIKGNLECSENFLVEGAVEGNLNSHGTIVLGKDAVVRGEVRAREVAVSGVVVGTIRCLDRLEIFESAKIIGTIQAPVLKMEPGAQINGRVLLSGKDGNVELLPQSTEGESSAAAKPHR